jgi:xanthine/uracil/vitamin C permease (AzgA family)
MKYLTLATKLAAGIALVWFGFINVHMEMLRSTPSNVRIGLFVGIGLLGALVMPSIGDAIAQAAKNGIALGSLGRRAYDGKGVTVTADTPADKGGAA